MPIPLSNGIMYKSMKYLAYGLIIYLMFKYIPEKEIESVDLIKVIMSALVILVLLDFVSGYQSSTQVDAMTITKKEKLNSCDCSTECNKGVGSGVDDTSVSGGTDPKTVMTNVSVSDKSGAKVYLKNSTITAINGTFVGVGGIEYTSANSVQHNASGAVLTSDGKIHTMSKITVDSHGNATDSDGIPIVEGTTNTTTVSEQGHITTGDGHVIHSNGDILTKSGSKITITKDGKVSQIVSKDGKIDPDISDEVDIIGELGEKVGGQATIVCKDSNGTPYTKKCASGTRYCHDYSPMYCQNGGSDGVNCSSTNGLMPGNSTISVDSAGTGNGTVFAPPSTYYPIPSNNLTKKNNGNNDGKMKYSGPNYNYLPLAERPGAKNQGSFEHGYSFLPPAEWYPVPPKPPVCVTDQNCPVCPVFTNSSFIDVKEWNASRHVTPSDDINNIDYVENKLN